MQVIGEGALIFALFNLGSGEVILILALLVVLLCAGNLPEIARGMGEGVSGFRKALRTVLKGTDKEAEDSGKSVGGIYGKPAAEALTSDNQTAELYDPAAFQNRERAHESRKRAVFLTWSRLWRLLRDFVFQRLLHR